MLIYRYFHNANFSPAQVTSFGLVVIQGWRGRFAMSVCIAFRDDYDGVQLRALARRSRDPRQVRRLLALAAACGGISRTEAAKVGGMDRQTL